MARRLEIADARSAELGPWLDRDEVMVQFWLKPSEAAVMVRGEEQREERIPEQLERFL